MNGNKWGINGKRIGNNDDNNKWKYIENKSKINGK